uniref:SMP-30/Gluconolactonase/LRE-like region domain-containing protein n=1 Tax=Timspurckia oligopyrenoides TaxID=708627 RepID=A0A7S1ETR8_9RHOD|mmetsp:Transcript_6782/g.12119  ORF Transcript_6782/g.12119 Transcript_6782/m.12119 type:complete len:381 (+) Transcript_6782:65-1207(+)
MRVVFLIGVFAAICSVIVNGQTSCNCEQAEFSNCLIATSTPGECESYGSCAGYVCVENSEITCSVGSALSPVAIGPPSGGIFPCAISPQPNVVPNWAATSTSVDLGIGSQPEGITNFKSTDVLVSSLAGRPVLRVNIATGAVSEFSQTGQVTVGMYYSLVHDKLYAAGGPTGLVHTFRGTDGARLNPVNLDFGSSNGNLFINDLVVVGNTLYITDSFNPRLLVCQLSTEGVIQSFSEVPLGGAFVQPDGFGSNGIEFIEGKLVLISSSDGALYQMTPPAFGQASVIATRVAVGTALTFGDGLRKGEDDQLYVVRNRINRVEVLRLSEGALAGSIEKSITSPLFDVPTTVTVIGSNLYLPNARFGNPDPTGIQYQVVRVPR